MIACNASLYTFHSTLCAGTTPRVFCPRHMDSPTDSLDSGRSVFTTSSAEPPRRACDACRRRKIKCIRSTGGRCSKCILCGLLCTFDDPIQKKGPRPRLFRPEATSAPLYHHPQRTSSQSSSTGCETCVRPRLVSDAGVKTCMSIFFDRIQPHMPIVDWEYTHDLIDRLDSDCQSYCVVLSLCAYTMLVGLPADEDVIFEGNVDNEQANGWGVLETVRGVRKQCYGAILPTTSAIIAATFMSCTYENLDDQNMAWYFLREATTMVYTANVHQEDHYLHGNPADLSRKRCIFWFLFVRERVHALRNNRPVSLHATINRPAPNNCILSDGRLTTFTQLIALYEPFSMDIISVWNGIDTSGNAEALERVHAEVRDVLAIDTSGQQHERLHFRCTQTWLHVLIWQSALRKGLLSSNANSDIMSFDFPLRAAETLLWHWNDVPVSSMLAFGPLLVR